MNVASAPAATGLKVFDYLPDGHLAAPVTEFCSSVLIQPGDIAVIDLESTWLEDGGLYLRRFIRVDDTSTCSIWEARQKAFKFDGVEQLGWLFLHHKAPNTLAARRNIPKEFPFLPYADGPYEFSGPRSEKTRAGIIGRVVGLLSDLEGHARHTATNGLEICAAPVLSPSQIHFRGGCGPTPDLSGYTHEAVPL